LKFILKKLVFGIAILITSPLMIGSWIEKKFTKSEMVFVSFGQLLALFPGIIGSYLRSAYYFASSEKSSWEVHIGFGSFLSHRGSSLGRHVAIGSFCVIGSANIGDGVMIASRVSIPSGKRQHLDENGRLTNTQSLEKITIGRNSWIGEGAIILANVGRNSIVSAGAIVAANMPDDCLIGGNPGRILKKLDSNQPG
jgi:acetyltransferase-like isoleucine patch superfamily enzyme